MLSAFRPGVLQIQTRDCQQPGSSQVENSASVCPFCQAANSLGTRRVSPSSDREIRSRSAASPQSSQGNLVPPRVFRQGSAHRGRPVQETGLLRIQGSGNFRLELCSPAFVSTAWEVSAEVGAGDTRVRKTTWEIQGHPVSAFAPAVEPGFWLRASSLTVAQ